MTATRRPDGKIKGFVVAKDCRFYDQWKYAPLMINSTGHYQKIKAMPTSIEDWTFVNQHSAWGKGGNSTEFDGFRVFMFNPSGDPSYYGEWFSAD